MIGEEDILFRPILHKQMYRMESLYDGTLDLQAVMLANEALDILYENERRDRVANQQGG
jgi:hypothetical protein